MRIIMVASKSLVAIMEELRVETTTGLKEMKATILTN
jgi:hypothetical protein